MRKGEWHTIGFNENRVGIFLTKDLVIIRDVTLPTQWSDGTVILTKDQWKQIKKAIKRGDL